VQRQQTEAEVQRLDRQLARGDLKPAERSELQRQRAALAALAPPGVILLIGFLLWRRFRPRRPAPPTEA